MQVPIHSYDASGTFEIFNGAPAKSGHILEIDQWATHLATGSHPMTPCLFLTSNNETHTSGSPKGIYISSESWSDYVTIPMLVPACCNYVTFRAVVTGKGRIRAKGTHMAAAALIHAQGADVNEHTAETRAQAWCDGPGETATDSNKPVSLVAGGTSGNLVPRRLEFQFSYRAEAYNFAIHALIFNYWLLEADTDLTTFVDSTGGNAP